MDTSNNRILFSKQGYWLLFVITAFPIHLWAYIQLFQDISWMKDRVNELGLIAAISYALSFALIESIFLFLIIVPISFLTPKSWTIKKRVVFCGILITFASLWAMAAQFYLHPTALWETPIFGLILNLLRRTYLRYVFVLIITVISFGIPAYIIYKMDKAVNLIWDFFDRISILMSIYVFVDVVAIIFVTWRNISALYNRI